MSIKALIRRNAKPYIFLRIAAVLLRSRQLLVALGLLVGAIRRRGLLGRDPDGSPPANPPRLSIILPIKDVERTARACVESMLQQDYPNLELVIAYHVLKEQKPYQDLGKDYFDRPDRERLQRRHVHRLEALGCEVSLKPTAA